MNFLKKISVRHVLGRPTNKEFRKWAEGKGTMVMRVIGQATDLRVGQSEFGTWTGFKGAFEAVNLFTGEIFRATQCFLPPVLTEPLAQSLAQLQEKDKGAKLEFAFDVGLVESAAPIGYEFVTKSLVEAKTADPLSDLRAKLPQIPTKKAEEKEPEPKGGKK